MRLSWRPGTVRDHGGAAQSDQGEKEGKVLLGATKRRGGGFETRHHSVRRCTLYLSRVARSLCCGDQACQACRVGAACGPRFLHSVHKPFTGSLLSAWADSESNREPTD